MRKEQQSVKAGYSVGATLVVLLAAAQAMPLAQTAALAFPALPQTQTAALGQASVQPSAYTPLPQPEDAPATLTETAPKVALTLLQQGVQMLGGVLQALPALPLTQSGKSGPLSWLVWGGAALVLMRLLLAYRRMRRYGRAVQAGKRFIESLADRLQIRCKQLVFQNAYGTTIYDKWEREKTAFMQREMLTFLTEQGYAPYFERATPVLLAYLDKVAFDTPAPPEQKLSNPDVYSPDMDPFDYERYCARQLRQMGWEAIATSECGDQGADVVASRGNTRIILQCKLYSKAVGNDAVQQVSAARQHYSARYAAVVSNAPYTIPAQQLAKTNKVFLLHHDELQRFIRRVEKSPAFRVR